MSARYRIKYKRNSHQVDFHDDVTTKFLHLSSGFGGGKTYAAVLKVFQLSMLNRHIPGGIVVVTLADFKKDMLPLFEEILDANKIKYRYHKTECWFIFPWSRAKIYVATAEKKIRGPNWGWCVMNEVTLISHERYKEAVGRVRIKRAKHSQIASSGTPEGTGHWAYEIFIDNPMKRSRIIYGDTRNNLENLSEDYVDTLESSYDPIMLDAYLRGLFVNMKGNRFYYAYDPKINDDKTIERLEDEEVHVSLDYNVSPMIATLWNVIDITDKRGNPTYDKLGNKIRVARAFDTIVIEDGAETKNMCIAFAKRGLDPETTTIYPDPAGKARSTSGPPDNEILKLNGWHKIKVRLSAPQFRKRQLGVCNLLAKGLIKMNPTTCKPLKKDCEAVEQDKATFEKLKDNPKLTHASDGMDYMMDILFPLSGHKPEIRSIKYR